MSKTDEVNKINVTGDGEMVVNSDMTAFVGELTVVGGSLTLNTGIGEYDMAMQEAVNAANKTTAANYTSVGTKITLTNDGDLTTGDLAVNNKFAIDVTSGTLKTGAITVVKSAEYKDLVVGTEGAAASKTTIGDASLTADDTAEIGSITVNAEGAKFAADGTGSMTVLGDIAVEAGTFTSSTAKASAANVSSKVAGGFKVEGGEFVAGNVVAGKAGAVDVAAGSKLTATGDITGEKGGVTVAGTLVTDLANVVNYDVATGKAAALTNAVVAFNTNGSLETTDEMDFTVDAWSSIKTAAGVDHLKMGNGTLVAATPDGKLSFADVSKVEGYAGHAVVYKTAEADGSVTVLPSNAMTIGKIIFEQADKGEKITDVTIGAANKAHFVIRGTETAGDNVIEGVDASTKIGDFVITNTTFGEKAGDQGVLGYDVTMNDVEVADGTNFSFKTIKTTGNFTVYGTATVANFDAASTANIAVDGGVLAMHGYVPGEEGVTETVRTFSTVSGTTLSNGALFAADDQLAAAQQYKAMYEQAAADDVAAGWKEKLEAVNMIYVAEKTHFTNALSFGQTTEDDFAGTYNVVAIDLAGVAKNGFDASKDAIITVDIQRQRPKHSRRH